MRKTIGMAVFVGTAAIVVSPQAYAGPVEDAVAGLAASSEEKIEESIRQLAALDDPRALPALDALATTVCASAPTVTLTSGIRRPATSVTR